MAITAAQLMVKVGADISDAERGLQSVSDRLSGFGKAAATVGGMLTAGLTLPLVGVAKSALDTAMDYQSSLNMMQAVSGATAEQMARVAETAKALGADMSLPATSAGDAAKAMTELAKAGLSVEQSMAAAKGVLQLSAAGSLSNAAAAEITANALNAFGLEGTRATDVANMLAAAANASSAEVTDVADSLKMASAVFASAGVPIEELVASIGQMANAGIKGSDAGTSLKGMLLSLQAPTDKAKNLMNELGINIYDAQGTMLPFGSIIEQFSSKLGDLTQEQRNAALATIFGSDAVRAANIVLMGGVEAHNQMLAAVTREGAAADLAGARMQGLTGALQGLQSQLETVLLEVAEPFLGTLEGWVRGLADLVPKISELDPNLRNAALAFAGVLAAAGPVLLILGGIASALAFLASPIGLIVVAVAALAAAWAADFGGIRDVTAGVLEAVLSIVQGALGMLQDWWQAHGEDVLATATALWQGIQQVVERVLGAVVPFVQQEFGVIIAWAEENWPRIQQVVEAVMTAVLAVVSAVLTAVRRAWDEHGADVMRIVNNALRVVGALIDLYLRNVLDTVTLVLQLLTGDWRGAHDTLVRIGERSWRAIQTIVSAVADSVMIALRSLLEWLRATISGYADAAAALGRAIADGILGALGGLGARLSEALAAALRQVRVTVGPFTLDAAGFRIASPTLPDVTGGAGGFGVGAAPEIPGMAAGGIVTRPTLALLGEAGPEAVLPLRAGTAPAVGPSAVINLTVDAGDLREDRIRAWIETTADEARRLVVATLADLVGAVDRAGRPAAAGLPGVVTP